MTKTDVTLALIAIVLALGIVLLARLPRRVVVLVVASIVGVVAGVLMLLPLGVSIAICDFIRQPVVDTCSGTYVSGHRLPQFMQSHPEAWMIGTAALVGVVLMDGLALVTMWAWGMRRSAGAQDSA